MICDAQNSIIHNQQYLLNNGNCSILRKEYSKKKTDWIKLHVTSRRKLCCDEFNVSKMVKSVYPYYNCYSRSVWTFAFSFNFHRSFLCYAIVSEIHNLHVSIKLKVKKNIGVLKKWYPECGWSWKEGNFFLDFFHINELHENGKASYEEPKNDCKLKLALLVVVVSVLVVKYLDALLRTTSQFCFIFFSTFFSQWFSIYLSLSILLSLSSLLAIYLSPSSPTFYSCVLWIVCYVRFSFSLALLPSLLFCFSLSLAICLSSLTFFFWSSFMILQDTSKLGM